MYDHRCSIVFFDAGQHQTIGCGGSIKRAGLILDVSKGQGRDILSITFFLESHFIDYPAFRYILPRYGQSSKRTLIITSKDGESDGSFNSFYSKKHRIVDVHNSH